jgi:hypothetical protein
MPPPASSAPTAMCRRATRSRAGAWASTWSPTTCRAKRSELRGLPQQGAAQRLRAPRAAQRPHRPHRLRDLPHPKQLEDNNVVLRDWVHPTWDEEEGIWEPTDIYRSGKPGKGLIYLWFNGNGTFLANALGNNPEGDGSYDPLMQQIAEITDPEVIAAVRAKAESSNSATRTSTSTPTCGRHPAPVAALARDARQAPADDRQNLRSGDGRRREPHLSVQALQRHDVRGHEQPGPVRRDDPALRLRHLLRDRRGRPPWQGAIRDPIVQRMYQSPSSST